MPTVTLMSLCCSVKAPSPDKEDRRQGGGGEMRLTLFCVCLIPLQNARHLVMLLHIFF